MSLKRGGMLINSIPERNYQCFDRITGIDIKIELKALIFRNEEIFLKPRICVVLAFFHRIFNGFYG